MTDIQKKIQEIKLARMGPEYRFVAGVFSDLEVRYSVRKPGCTFYLINGVPIFQYMRDGKYFWCHNGMVWSVLLEMLKNDPYDPVNRQQIIEIRKIIGHFALGYLNLSNLTVSMANTIVTDSWKTLKLIKRKPWK